MCSASPSKSQPWSAAMPLNRPQWYGTAPPPCGMIRPQAREVAHEPRAERLHECGGVGAEIVRARGVEVLVARGRHVDHGGHVELAHRLPQRPPRAVPQRRPGPEPARRVGVHVAADETHLADTPPQFGDRAVDGGAGRLRELAHRSEVRRVQVAHSPDQLVLVLRPERRRVFVADVVGHPARPWREQGEIGAAVALELQLGRFQTRPDLVVGHVDRALLTHVRRVAVDRRHLGLAPRADTGWRRRVVPVTVDDHRVDSNGLSTILRSASGRLRTVFVDGARG